MTHPARRSSVATLFAAAVFALAAMLAGHDDAAAQPSEVAATAPAGVLQAIPNRPRVGLVLSGGGARGGAHLGVLKVLEEMHVPVDVIVGTSAGAIIGAAYASGMPLRQIEKEMGALRTEMLFRDADRRETPWRIKSNDTINYVGPELGLQNGSIALPKGVVAGVSIEAVLRQLTARQRDDDFDKLPIRFRAVATDLTSSEMVVLSRGSLAVAVRASMAIPAVVDPVELDGRLLVDGGLARNLPVDVARALGAEQIIAVNIGTPLRTRDEITGILTVSDQISRILTNTNVTRSLAELGPQDLLITPDLGTVQTADFDRLPEAAAAGEAAARKAQAELVRFGVAAAAYERWRAALTVDPTPKGELIDAVRVTGTQRVNPEVIVDSMQTRAGRPLDPKVIDEDMKRIYARGDFERVGYSIVDDPAQGRVLVADVAEKSWGPNYLRFGLGLSSDLRGDSFFSLVTTYRRTWLNSLGAEWRTDARIGHSDRLSTELYQPLTPAQRLFVAARAEVSRDPFDVYDEDGSRVARYRRGTYGIGFDIGTPLGTFGEARIGLDRGRLKLYNDTGSVEASLVVPSVDMGGASARVRLDTLDNLRFPRSGYAADLQVYWSRPRLGATDNYTKASANFTTAVASGAHSLQFGLRGATSLGNNDLPVYELYSLGGFLQLSGYKTDELLGRELAFGRMVYNYRVSQPGLLDGAYFGVSLESGRIGAAVTGANRASARYGASIYFAFDSPIGPVYIAYGHGDGRNQAVYFYVGQP
ncbi:MAG TPA: patatin-like phospholipase family protein [Burkholderiaceae bacterium]|nr:patatin-like phospholipase family protein [Burkholderiaceae bacterium]